MAETTIHGIEFQIKGSAKDAASALTKLQQSLEAIKKAMAGGIKANGLIADLNKIASAASKNEKSAKNLKTLASSLKTISKLKFDAKEINNLVESIKKLDPLADSLKKFEDIGKIKVSSLAKQLSELNKVVTEMSDDTVKKIDDVAKALERLKGIDFKGFAGAARAARAANGAGEESVVQDSGKEESGGETGVFRTIKSLSGLKSELGATAPAAAKATMAIGSFAIKVGGTLYSVLKRVSPAAFSFTKALVAMPFKSSISNAKEYASKIGNVLHQFKRVAGYRLIRTALKEITQGFQEGTKNLYEWSTLVGGQFAKNMDDAATSMLYFKNSIGAAWSPLMNVLAPALRAVTDAAVDLLNIINQLLARLTGQTSWTRAKRVATEYGDAVAGAGQAAKEAMRYLAPFDELNVLPDDKDRGGGGGAANNMSEMFEEVATFDEGIADFADKVREAIQSSNWIGLGVLLGEKVNEVVDSLDWSAGGTKVGKGINAWFTTEYWTLETVNFQNIGSRVAEFLNSAIGKIDFNIIGRSLAQKFTILGDFILGAVENIDWAEVGNSIRDFLVGAFNQMSQWAKRIDWSEFGTNLYNDLKSFIEGLDFAGIASSLFTLLGSAIGAAASMLSSFISGAVDDIWNYFMSFAQDANGDGEIAGKEIFNAILKGIKNAVTGIWTWIKTNVWEPFVSGFKKAAGVDSEDGEGAGLGKTLGTKILEGLASQFTGIGTWLKEHVFGPIAEKFREFAEDHPAIAKILGLESGSVEVGGTTINENGFSGLSGKFDVEANIVSVTDSVPWEQKVSAHWTADIETGKDVIKPSEKALTSYTAQVTNAKDEVVPSKKKLENFEAYVYDFVDYIDQRELENMIAGVKKVNDEIPEKTKVVTGFTGSFSKTDTANLTASQKTIQTTANMTKRTVGDKVKDSIDVVADFVRRTVGDKVKAAINTTANFNKRKTGSLDKVINTVSNFTKRKTGFLDKVIDTTSNFIYRLTGDLDKTIDTTANFVSYTGLDDGVSAKLTVTEVLLDDNAWAQYDYLTRKNGGVFSGGAWRDIPQYASGGRPHGTAFIAGEAGPEIVGHIGGRTEVLNRSQLAATMYAAVSRAIMGVRFNINAINAPSTTSDSYDEDAMYRAMLRALNDSDAFPDEIDLDGDVVYRKMVKRNQMNTRMTGRNAMATA